MDAIYITQNTVFAATPGAKTVLKLVTPATFNIKVHEIVLSSDGIVPTAVPATVDVFTSTEATAGTGTGSALTNQVKGRAQAHGLTVTQNHSAEGTVYTVLKSLFLPQFMGFIPLPNPLGLEEESPGDAADSIGVRINVTANVNILCWIKWSRA